MVKQLHLSKWCLNKYLNISMNQSFITAKCSIGWEKVSLKYSASISIKSKIMCTDPGLP